MHEVHTLTFHGRRDSETVHTRLYLPSWSRSVSDQREHIHQVAERCRISPTDDTALAASSCWRSSFLGWAIRTVPGQEHELLEQINRVAMEQGVSFSKALIVAAERYDAIGDVRAGVLCPVYSQLRWQGQQLRAALRRTPIFSASACRQLMMAEGVAGEQAAGVYVAEAAKARATRLWRVVGVAIRSLVRSAGAFH